MKSKILLFIFGLIIITSSAYANQIKVISFQGDVEVKKHGKTDWIQVFDGMILEKGDFVSTGFESNASLVFEDETVLYVRQLTQMEIQEFDMNPQSVYANINLEIGNLRAKVSRTENVKTDFVVSTPTSVVSVRGTDEEITQSDLGTNVFTHEGLVQAQTAEGRTVNIAQNQETNLTETELTLPTDEANKQSRSDLIEIPGETDEEQEAKKDVEEPVSSVGYTGKTETEETSDFLYSKNVDATVNTCH